MGVAAHQPIAHQHHHAWPRGAVKALEVTAFTVALLLILAAAMAFMLVTEPPGGESMAHPQYSDELPTVTGTIQRSP